MIPPVGPAISFGNTVAKDVGVLQEEYPGPRPVVERPHRECRD